MKPISSGANPRYKALRKLVQSSQERRRTGLSMLDGVRKCGFCWKRCPE